MPELLVLSLPVALLLSVVQGVALQVLAWGVQQLQVAASMLLQLQVAAWVVLGLQWSS